MRKGVAIALALCVIAAVPSVGNADTKKERDYLRLVMDTFCDHVEAIELLTANPSKYSDNVVRHADAIANTEGLLDHAFPGDEHMEGSSHWPWRNETEFDRLVHAMHMATKELATAAQFWIKDRDRVRFMATLDKMRESCLACHEVSPDPEHSCEIPKSS
ncbi:MAG: Cytochrome c' [Rhodospirillaceae bacterium]|nr:MAG: Cytochrome c' [Rhodospirillaceae bacterium]